MNKTNIICKLIVITILTLLIMTQCLECGYLGQKIEKLEYIAIAPNIFDAHSPKERVEIASANKVWKIVEKLIENI